MRGGNKPMKMPWKHHFHDLWATKFYPDYQTWTVASHVCRQCPSLFLQSQTDQSFSHYTIKYVDVVGTLCCWNCWWSFAWFVDGCILTLLTLKKGEFCIYNTRWLCLFGQHVVPLFLTGMPKEKYDPPDPRRMYTIMSSEEAANGKKSHWAELEISGKRNNLGYMEERQIKPLDLKICCVLKCFLKQSLKSLFILCVQNLIKLSHMSSIKQC